MPSASVAAAMIAADVVSFASLFAIVPVAPPIGRSSCYRCRDLRAEFPAAIYAADLCSKKAEQLDI